jgi:hypothetical protein
MASGGARFIDDLVEGGITGARGAARGGADDAARLLKGSGETADAIRAAPTSVGQPSTGFFSSIKSYFGGGDNAAGAVKAGGDDAAAGAVKGGGDDAADAGRGAATQADEAGEAATKEANAAAKADKGKVETEASLLTKKNAAMGIGTVGGVAVGTIAYDNYKKKNNKQYNIISIDDVSIDSNIKTQITIKSDEKFSIYDTVKIENTNCVPQILGNFEIKEVNTKGKFIITTPFKITTKGTAGTLTFYTTFASQLAGVLNGAAEKTGKGLETLGGGLGGSLGDGLTNLLSSLGLSSQNIKMFFIVIGCIFGLIVLFAIYKFFIK